jgi:glycerol-3-phosphate dehydrogenase
MQLGELKPAVRGATGIHIILPSYYAPSSIGLVDMQTSDGRFMFLLPWQVMQTNLYLQREK